MWLPTFRPTLTTLPISKFRRIWIVNFERRERGVWFVNPPSASPLTILALAHERRVYVPLGESSACSRGAAGSLALGAAVSGLRARQLPLA